MWDQRSSDVDDDDDGVVGGDYGDCYDSANETVGNADDVSVLWAITL